MTAEKAAKQLAADIIERYKHLMDDEDKRDAVIIKAIAIVALAYGFPPVLNEPLDVEDVLNKLIDAEHVLAGTRRTN